MLDSHGFNLWAGDYDKAVEIADNNEEYPFAGYKELMNAIYVAVMKNSPAKVLDIGIGTGTLAFKLYESGNNITGIDFSAEMLGVVRAKMPDAKLVEWDFSKGMPNDINGMKFDFIISTYALHHLTDDDKPGFILSLMEYLEKDGIIIIGDVSFQNRDDLQKCKSICGNAWDEDEYYFVFSELNEALKGNALFIIINFRIAQVYWRCILSALKHLSLF